MSHSRPRFAAFALLAIIGVVTVFAVRWQFRATPRSSDPTGIAVASTSWLPRPAPRDDHFVGSQACRECHTEIFDQYIASPMGQSTTTVHDAVPVETYNENLVRSSPQRHYRATLDDGVMTHHEILLDTTGEPFAEQSETISLVVGSGQRGRSYLINHSGLLFQSPLGWYSHGQRWDLSPGYTPDKHPRFSRRIGDGCLYCHAGRMHHTGLAADRYGEPVFAELAIGCERCHGPGQRHVQLHQGSRAGNLAEDASLVDPIVNPADLTISQRESVCYQCHLLGRSVITRYGRRFFDYRPGDELEDIFVILMQEVDTRQPSTQQAVNQVEQLRASTCYQASEGKLGCISCHDPHSTPAPDRRVEHYRQRCLACHESRGCSVDEARRHEPPANNSCIHCHMASLPAADVPHTSLTDHRIPRDRDTGDRDTAGAPSIATASASGATPATLAIFGDAAKRLPRIEVERARGISQMTEAWRQRDEHLAASALTQLLEALDGPVQQRVAAIDDVPLLGELAAGYMLLRNFEMAETCWKRMLALDPHNENALMGLAKVAEERQDRQGIEAALDQLEALNPLSEELFILRVKQRHYGGDPDGAIQAAERVLEINPTNSEMRIWLAQTYRQRRNAEHAQRHEEFLRKLGVTIPNESTRSSR